MAGDGDTSAENGQNHGERSVFNGLELSSPQRVEETPEVMEELEKDNKGGGGPHAAAPAVTTTGEGVEGDGKSAKGAGKAAVPKVPFMQLFKFADSYDKLLMVLGFLGAVGDGATTPGMLFVMSGLINIFGQKQTTTNFMHEISKYALYFVYIAIGAFVACYLEASCWLRTADRQAARMRAMYLRATLRQDVGFFDTAGAGVAEVVNSVSTDTMAIQEAIGEKVGNFVMNITGFVAGIIVSLLLVWRLGLIVIAFLPVLLIPGYLYGRSLLGLAKKSHAAYLQASVISEQALSSVRTVYSFVGEQRTSASYSKALEPTVSLGRQIGFIKGLATGSSGITFAIWALMAWYGSRLIINDGVQGGKVTAAGIVALMGGLNLGIALPNLTYFAEGQIAAYRIFAMIARVPQIDSDDMTGTILENIAGEIEFRNVAFSYPSRPKQSIFRDFCLTVPAGKTLALVGGSGSGKSTAIALLERFYDPSAGSILIDGVNIKDLQLKWLHYQIGLVSQEPSLFATSIKENILFGKDGATMDEVIAAAKASNAHNFISSLPNGYDTQVGERGVQMSGGQKQRIAIARAMLKNPPILLLDEATSALDAESEQIVQSALDQASVGRTTIVVAHRLSTIRNADLIAVVQGGSVIELGSHDDLLKHEHGAYALLIHLQQTQPSTAQELESGASNSRSLSIKRSSSFRRSVSFHHQASNPRNADGLSPKQSGLRPQSDEIEKKAKPPSLRRLLGLNRPEWRQAILGVIGAIGSGVVHPLYAFTLGSMISTFYEPNHAKMRREIEHYSLIFAALAVASFAVNVLRDYFFGDMGTILTKRIRENMLSKVLTFEVGWYDKDENSSGAVSSKLATDATVVRSLVGDRVALLVQTVGAILIACIIGLVVAWPLALVMMALQPIIIIGFYLKKVLLKSMSAATYKAQEEASQVASEAVANHRTITAFSSQDKMLKLFESKQDGPRREASYRALIAGFGLGIAQFCTLGTWAFDFWYGGKLVNDGRITFADMFKTFFILVSTGRLIADAGSMTSDLAKGSNTLTSVFEILDRTTRIRADDADAEKLDKVEGNIEVRDVDFAYPMRPDVMVFKGFSLRVKAGRSIALVGQSGSGKSTIIGLIERYYDPLKGEVRIDGKDIKRLHLQTLRRHIALVGQEPTLFSGTIRENILYGRENATEAEIIEAAKAANAHNFISSLHNGYNTSTGERGLQMSGGQKQRIAIARAILKNPAILLLDEATSALDAQSEKIVQDALDRIMVGRTTVVVAHRLSTVQNAESIAVLQGGAILEQGRHHELLAKGEGGAYYDLVKLQNKAH